MKCVILAGGFGSRISEESQFKPKPMVEIGGRPVLWHIMKIYSHYGIDDFVICLGYKGYFIKEYFANYFLHMSDVTLDIARNKIEVHQRNAEPWRVTLIDTGENTMTGGRLKRVRQFVGDESFCFTYGDGLSDVAIDELTAFHRQHGKLATLTAIQPPGRWGTIELGAGGAVGRFQEKPAGDGAWINGGFFVCEPGVIDYIKEDSSIWEREPMEKICADGQMMVYKHEGFWKPMDTLRDKMELENEEKNESREQTSTCIGKRATALLLD
jgi:glucose-1-phosphate cytidylyltransferase